MGWFKRLFQFETCDTSQGGIPHKYATGNRLYRANRDWDYETETFVVRVSVIDVLSFDELSGQYVVRSGNLKCVDGENIKDAVHKTNRIAFGHKHPIWDTRGYSERRRRPYQQWLDDCYWNWKVT